MGNLLSVSEVAAVEAGWLRVVWDDGVTRVVDIRAKMTKHLALEMLAVPEIFRDVSVVPGGGGVEWPNGADFTARSLRIWSDEQSDMNARKAS